MKVFIFLLELFLILGCSTSKIGVRLNEMSDRTYSTGYLGMPGEFKFVFLKNSRFYFSERLTYSEGTYEWIDNRQIKFKARYFDNSNPDSLGRKFDRSIDGKTAIIHRKKLIFD